MSRDLESFEEFEQGPIFENKRIQRRLIPFVTRSKAMSSASSVTLSGVFFTGDRPHWIVCTDKSGTKLVPCSHPIVHAFTTCSVWDSQSDFLLYTDEVSDHQHVYREQFMHVYIGPVSYRVASRCLFGYCDSVSCSPPGKAIQ